MSKIGKNIGDSVREYDLLPVWGSSRRSVRYFVCISVLEYVWDSVSLPVYRSIDSCVDKVRMDTDE